MLVFVMLVINPCRAVPVLLCRRLPFSVFFPLIFVLLLVFVLLLFVVLFVVFVLFVLKLLLNFYQFLLVLVVYYFLCDF